MVVRHKVTIAIHHCQHFVAVDYHIGANFRSRNSFTYKLASAPQNNKAEIYNNNNNNNNNINNTIIIIIIIIIIIKILKNKINNNNNNSNNSLNELL